MIKPSNRFLINNLKRNLNDSIVNHKFNLAHPQVIAISLEINTLLTPLFRKQLTQTKVIQFPK